MSIMIDVNSFYEDKCKQNDNSNCSKVSFPALFLKKFFRKINVEIQSTRVGGNTAAHHLYMEKQNER